MGRFPRGCQRVSRLIPTRRGGGRAAHNRQEAAAIPGGATLAGGWAVRSVARSGDGGVRKREPVLRVPRGHRGHRYHPGFRPGSSGSAERLGGADRCAHHHAAQSRGDRSWRGGGARQPDYVRRPVRCGRRGSCDRRLRDNDHPGHCRHARAPSPGAQGDHSAAQFRDGVLPRLRRHHDAGSGAHVHEPLPDSRADRSGRGDRPQSFRDR